MAYVASQLTESDRLSIIQFDHTAKIITGLVRANKKGFTENCFDFFKQTNKVVNYWQKKLIPLLLGKNKKEEAQV